MSSRIRIGVVAYLNAKPLVWGLPQALDASRMALIDDVPSALAARLTAGELDMALLPTIELARNPGLTVVPGLGISSRGPAGSVLLVTRKPVAEVRSVALDPESRTTNALVRVLFAQAWGQTPEFAPGSLDLDDSLATHDAAVRIGDKALFGALPSGCEAIDLGAAWARWTNLPFVYAVWAAREGVVDRKLYTTLHDARRRGLANLDRIAADYRWEGLPRKEISLEYLTRRIFYRLGAPEVEGLERFLRAAHVAGIVDAPEPVRLARFSSTACDLPAPAV